jgi:hypothetical protein
MLRSSPPAVYVAAAFGSFLAPFLTAQNVDPIGRVHPAAQPLVQVASLAVAALDRGAIALEDERQRAAGMPARYALPVAVDVTPATHGTWEVLDNTWSLWRLRIQAPNSSHINLGFATFQLPTTARLMVYSSNYQDVVRPFDSNDHGPTGELWTPVVATEEIVAEIYVPTQSRALVQLRLTQVGAGYRFFGAGPTALGLDGSGSCNVDVVCPLASGWTNQIRSVAAISSAGSIFCSGSMVNNTAQDARNYFLTANHCGVTAGVAASLVCYWNYQETVCGGSGASLAQFTTGATLRSTWSNSDFTLVELNSAPNPAWGVTYAGWNRGTGNTTAATAIHHPSGDSKKISFEYQATTTTSYLGTTSPGAGTHLRVIDWDDGTTEGGSSGSPLFDQNRRVVGQLHGGFAACGNNDSDWYGRFSVSWTGNGTNATRLSNWLDPLGTGATTLDTFVPGGGTLAAATSYGNGCYTSTASFAQTFLPNTFDLSGTATSTVGISFVPITNGYTLQSGPNLWFAPVAANLNLGDDALSAALNLPFTFNFPGGSTTQLRMCSNGFVWLNGTSTITDFSPTAAELAAGPARLAPAWMDLDPTAAGSCHFDIDPSNTAVYLTWNNVPHYTTGTPGLGNTFQVVLRSNGSIDYRFRAVPNQIGACVVGYSRGVTAVPPNLDLSTALPFQVTVDSAGLAWNAVNRPLLGTTQTINLANIPNPASSIGLVLLGLSRQTPAINLGVIGAPNCFLHLPNIDIRTLFPLGSSTVPWNFAIPNTASLAGFVLTTQGALLVPPGTNAFGLLTANGVELTLGNL